MAVDQRGCVQLTGDSSRFTVWQPEYGLTDAGQVSRWHRHCGIGRESVLLKIVLVLNVTAAIDELPADTGIHVADMDFCAEHRQELMGSLQIPCHGNRRLVSAFQRC